MSIIIFFLLKMMKYTPPQQWVHDEMKNLDRTQFMFQDKQYSREYAQTLAENLHSYAPEHILDGKFISGE